LDYYNLTVFEWVTDKLGSQATICGGGRYDDLIALLGGKPAPAVGFAIGMERLLDLWLQSGAQPARAECDVYMVHQTEAAGRQAMVLAEQMRDAGLRVLVHAGGGQFKAQFRRADASGARIAVILGEDELVNAQASIKWLRQGDQPGQDAQVRVPFAQLAFFLKGKV
jgi:histidyl-tRNA synthetase